MNVEHLISLTGLLILTQLLFAQTFTEIPPPSPFSGVNFSSVAFSDINGNGYQDVLITGRNSSNEGSSKLYTNDGLGNFTEIMNTPFDDLLASSAAFADINSDGHQDVLITGAESFSLTDRIAKLYSNDGLGNFTEMEGTPFDGVWFSTVAFSDVNGDGYQDVLITGQNSSGQYIAKLYTNDGLGNFTEITGTPFEGLRFSAVAFSDVNSDGYQDVLITGQNSSEERIAKLYTNDGLGNFIEMTDTPFEGVWESSVAFSDVNGDGHQDVFITGAKSSSEAIAKLYTNDGLGNFTEMTNTPFDGVWRSTMAFSDVNGDEHQDVLIAGQSNSGQRITKLYTNDGLGNFTEVADIPFDGVRFGSLAFSDVNSDGYQDVLITGENILGQIISKLYTNDGEISSTEALNIEFTFDFIPYPNPTTSNQLNIMYKATKNGVVSLKVYQLNGRLLSRHEETVAIGQHIFSIDITSFARGIYLIQMDDDKRNGIAKFMIQ